MQKKISLKDMLFATMVITFVVTPIAWVIFYLLMVKGIIVEHYSSKDFIETMITIYIAAPIGVWFCIIEPTRLWQDYTEIKERQRQGNK